MNSEYLSPLKYVKLTYIPLDSCKERPIRYEYFPIVSTSYFCPHPSAPRTELFHNIYTMKLK